MGESNFIPLMQAACYLAYGKEKYDEWVAKYDNFDANDRDKKSPLLIWLMATTPEQKFPEDETEYEKQKHKIIQESEDVKRGYRNHIRQYVTKIIQHAVGQDTVILLGKSPAKIGYHPIPSYFLMLVKDGLSIYGDVNLQHSHLLVFNGRDFKHKCADKNCAFMHTYFKDVLVDFSALKTLSPRNRKGGRRAIYNWILFRDTFEQMHAHYGGFDPQAEDGYTNAAAAARKVIAKLEREGIKTPDDEKDLAKKIRIWEKEGKSIPPQFPPHVPDNH